jgi:hypothetical protein
MKDESGNSENQQLETTYFSFPNFNFSSSCFCLFARYRPWPKPARGRSTEWIEQIAKRHRKRQSAIHSAQRRQNQRQNLPPLTTSDGISSSTN